MQETAIEAVHSKKMLYLRLVLWLCGLPPDCSLLFSPRSGAPDVSKVAEKPHKRCTKHKLFFKTLTLALCSGPRSALKDVVAGQQYHRP